MVWLPLAAAKRLPSGLKQRQDRCWGAGDSSLANGSQVAMSINWTEYRVGEMAAIRPSREKATGPASPGASWEIVRCGFHVPTSQN